MIDIEFHWHINHFCNFKCDYCFCGRMKNAFIGPQSVQRVIDAFDGTGLTCLINISGGEPFFTPNFLRLCKNLTRRHIISINTNLSHKDVFHFAELIHPKRVKYISCSLHMQERERLGLVQDFIEKYKFLESKGFLIFAPYVMYPPLINRFSKDYAYFKSKGIILRPKVFRGDYSKSKLINLRIFKRIKPIFRRIYPNSYTRKQKEKILSYIAQSERDGNFHIFHETSDVREGRILDLSLDRFFINGLPSFRGKYCLTGKSYVRMTPTGDVYRCQGSNLFLGNLFKEKINLFDRATECTQDVCLCPYLGYSYTTESSFSHGRNILPFKKQ